MIDFIKEFIKEPRKVGSVIPSSNYLVEEMCNIKFENCKCIVEYGPGTGVFSHKIISKKNENTILLLIEKNKNFFNYLSKLYCYKDNVIIINDGAENIKKYLNKYNIKKIDYIISGLPFTSLPNNLSNNILNTSKDIICNYGEFRTFQYSLMKKYLFEKYFNKISITKILINFPPANLLVCKNTN
jgi:phospholipid N-methyltransferase